MIVPVSFSLKRLNAPEEFSVDRVLADVVSTPDWKVDVEVAVYDTETQRGYGFKGRLVRHVGENPLDSMGTLYESKGDRLPAFGSREYLLELRAEVDRLLGSSLRSESEVRAGIERLAQETHGSYEELAGAEWALRWALGESGWDENDTKTGESS